MAVGRGVATRIRLETVRRPVQIRAAPISGAKRPKVGAVSARDGPGDREGLVRYNHRGSSLVVTPEAVPLPMRTPRRPLKSASVEHSSTCAVSGATRI